VFHPEKDKERIIVLQSCNEPLNAEEAFILSRIGTEIRLRDLYSLLPFAPEKTNDHLNALFKKKFLNFKDGKPGSGTQPATKSLEIELPQPEVKSAKKPIKEEKLSVEVQEILQSDQFDPDLRAIDKEFRKDILVKSEKIESKNPFDILGVLTGATDSEVREAYIRLSRKFHPDRFFRKKLGHYKRRLDFLFTKIQESYESLKNPFDREALARQRNAQSKAADPKVPAAAAKKLDPAMEKLGKAEHFFKLGQAALKVKDYSQAATQFQLAYQLNPARPQYKKAYDEVAPFLEIQRSDEMIKSAEDSITQGFPHDAIEIAERALRVAPDSVQARFILAKAILEAGEKSRVSEAIDLLRRVKTSLPQNPDPCVLLSQIYYAKKDTEKALKEIDEALRRDPNCAQAHKLLSKYSS